MSKKKIAVFDIETDPFKRDRIPEPFCADFFDGKTHRLRWGKNCVAELWEVMKDFGGAIFVHNGGKFDFHYILPYVDKRFMEVKIIGSTLAMIELPNGTQFRDSYKIIPAPLAAHDKGEIDYNKFEEEVRDLHQTEITEYLKRDCESLFDLVTEFVENYGLGLTIRGRAFSELRKMGYEIPQISRATDEMIRPFFYGGRVECFESGTITGKIDCYDINSAYPWAMTKNHPWGEKYNVLDGIPDENKDESFYLINANSAGAFPARNELGGIDFPRARQDFYVTGHELFFARKHGLAEKIKVKVCYQPKIVTNFKNYVDRFYEMKLEAEKAGDKVKRLFAKIFMNSCYGGFAINPDNFQEYKFTEYNETLDEPWQIQEIFPDGSLLWHKPSDDEQYYNVGTSASITGLVRTKLLDALINCKRPLYCDTDSIFCVGSNKIDVGDEVGRWKHEGRGEEIHIGGKKIYAFKLGKKWKCASKGAKLVPKQIISIAQGKTVTWKSEVPSYSMKKNITFVERKLTNRLTKQNKSLKLQKVNKK